MVKKFDLFMEPAATYDVHAKGTNAEEVHTFLTDVLHMDKLPEEHSVVISCDCHGNIIGFNDTTSGCTTECAVTAAHVFKCALLSNATTVILAHNHPSGDATPSMEDLATTAKIMQAGEIIGIPVLDHIVIAGDEYTSIRNFVTEKR